MKKHPKQIKIEAILTQMSDDSRWLCGIEYCVHCNMRILPKHAFVTESNEYLCDKCLDEIVCSLCATRKEQNHAQSKED